MPWWSRRAQNVLPLEPVARMRRTSDHLRRQSLRLIAFVDEIRDEIGLNGHTDENA